MNIILSTIIIIPEKYLRQLLLFLINEMIIFTLYLQAPAENNAVKNWHLADIFRTS